MVPEQVGTARLADGVRQFLKFGIVGGSGVAVNLLAMAVADNVGRHAFGVSYQDIFVRVFGPYAVRFKQVYNLIAFVVAVTWNFFLNRAWTFRSEGHGRRAPFWAEYGPFFLTGLMANLATMAIMTALTNHSSPVFLPDPPFTDAGPFYTKRFYWGQAVAILLTMPINFVVNKIWTFRAVRNRHAVKTTGDVSILMTANPAQSR